MLKIFIMCGIVCALDLKQSSDLLRSQVLEMSKKVRHRGPDWNGIHCGKNVLLAHERLAIVDPASGNQPIYSDDKNLILAAKANAAFNGKFSPDIEDVKAVAIGILRHRVVKNYKADAEGISIEKIIDSLL